MRLATKFALSFIFVALVIWGISSYIRITREAAVYETDMRRDHLSLGRDLSAAVSTIWQLGGESAAKAFVDRANASKANILIRLVERSDSAIQVADSIAKTSNLLIQGEWQEIRPNPDSSGALFLNTYIPVVAAWPRKVAVELSESLHEKANYVRTTVLRSIGFSALVALMAGLAAMILGSIVVARPVSLLVSKARQIAAGNLESSLDLKQKDELGELGRELNIMSNHLAEARQRVVTEASARQRAVEQLRHADRLSTVGRLAAMVAHELGTPINVIRVRARMIGDGEVAGDEVVACSKVIVEQSDRMTSTIAGLLNLSRRQAAQKVQLDVCLVLQQTIDLVQPLARKNHATIALTSSPCDMRCAIDPDQIRQVFTNLLINAIEAMPGGGVVSISAELVMTEPTPGEAAAGTPFVRVKVSDTGIGIPEELIGRVFDPFLTTKEAGVGTGLGLSIAADIVAEHGGKIEVESSPGGGTAFYIFLPTAHLEEA